MGIIEKTGNAEKMARLIAKANNCDDLVKQAEAMGWKVIPRMARQYKKKLSSGIMDQRGKNPLPSEIAQILYDYFESERESLWMWLKANDYVCADDLRNLIDSGATKLTVEHISDGSVYSATDGKFKATVMFPDGVRIEDDIKESIIRSVWRKSLGEGE